MVFTLNKPGDLSIVALNIRIITSQQFNFPRNENLEIKTCKSSSHNPGPGGHPTLDSRVPQS